MELKDMRFDVPDCGIIEGTNAAFVHFLHSLKRMKEDSTYQHCKLEDLTVGETGIAEFRSGAGRNTLVIRRVL